MQWVHFLWMYRILPWKSLESSGTGHLCIFILHDTTKHLKRLVFNFSSVWEHEWAFMARPFMPKGPHCSSPKMFILVTVKMSSVCFTNQHLMKSSIYCDITGSVPSKTIPPWACTSNFWEFQHSSGIFQEDQNTNILNMPTSRDPFSLFLDRLESNYCFPCATLLLKPARPSTPSGMIPCGHLVYPGLKRSVGVMYSAIWHYEQGVNNLFWDYINVL